MSWWSLFCAKLRCLWMNECDLDQSSREQKCEAPPQQIPILWALHPLQPHHPPPLPPPCNRSNRMMNNSISLPSIYFPQKLEPLLCCHNHCRRLRWAACIIIHIPAGSKMAMLTHYPRRQNAPWFMAMTQAFDCFCVCGTTIRKWSSQQKSNKERAVRRPSSHHNCGYLQFDIAVGSPDIFSAPGEMNQRLSPH